MCLPKGIHMYFCKFCSSERKNANSLRNHERLCKANPNKQETPFQDPDFQKKYEKEIENKKRSNQYIAAKERGERVVISIEQRKAISDRNKRRSKEWHIENGKRISETIRKKVEEGKWHTSLAKHMHYNYNGIDLHGAWEYKYAVYLDENKIAWVRCKESFEYIFEGKKRRYTPDFYLPETDEYIEIKGYKTKKDEAKWNQFPKHRNLIVLLQKDLKSLNII